MARKKNIELINRKKELINEVVKFALPFIKIKPVKVNRFYDELPELKDVWKTRAYFIQELKKYVPANIQIESSQRKGTFLKLKEPENFIKLRMKNAVHEKEFIAKVIDKLPENIKKQKTPKFIAEQLDGVTDVYKTDNGYIVKTESDIFEVREVQYVCK